MGLDRCSNALLLTFLKKVVHRNVKVIRLEAWRNRNREKRSGFILSMIAAEP